MISHILSHSKPLLLMHNTLCLCTQLLQYLCAAVASETNPHFLLRSSCNLELPYAIHTTTHWHPQKSRIRDMNMLWVQKRQNFIVLGTKTHRSQIIVGKHDMKSVSCVWLRVCVCIVTPYKNASQLPKVTCHC